MPERSEKNTKIAKKKAQRLKVPFVDPLRAAIEPSALSLLAPQMALRRQALPIRVVDNFLLAAMLTPEEPVAVKSLELLTGFKVRPAVAPQNSLSIALKKYYGNGSDAKPGGKNRRPATDQKTMTRTTKRGRSEPTTISVISNKGDVGKTHLAINMACCLAGKGARVLLIDADLGNADVSNKLGIFPKNHLMDFLQNRKKMEELLFRTAYGFDLIASSYGEFKLANLYYAQKIKFINNFRKISQLYEFAIFDLGAIPYERAALRNAEVKKKPLLFAAPRVKAVQSIQHMSTRFFHPDATYDPKVKFKQPLARFAAFLTQKISTL